MIGIPEQMGFFDLTHDALGIAMRPGSIEQDHVDGGERDDDNALRDRLADGIHRGGHHLSKRGGVCGRARYVHSRCRVYVTGVTNRGTHAVPIT
jgi:hypothetical protein